MPLTCLNSNIYTIIPQPSGLRGHGHFGLGYLKISRTTKVARRPTQTGKIKACTMINSGAFVLVVLCHVSHQAS